MSVVAPAGFVASAAAAGLKANGALDLALVATEDGRGVPVAAVFTSNKAAAAPVQVSRAHLVASGGRAAAVLLSAGNANAATGPGGVQAAEDLCQQVGRGLGVGVDEVLICQTGLIGVPFPLALASEGLKPLLAGRSASQEAGTRCASAIMTTDTVEKEVVVSGPGFVVGAMAKGAAMLAPDMATMLAVVTTDADAPPPVLANVLAEAVGTSFNSLSVDGSTSTNDTVVLLASGRRGAPDPAALATAVGEACAGLAEKMAADAEGATKVARITVTGARSDAEAHQAARSVAESALVKCSLNGADPYWGRVVSELGAAGVHFDLARVSMSYGGVAVCVGGMAADHDAQAVARHMAGSRIEISCDLGLGRGTGTMLATDLGHGYIEENRGTS